MSLEELVSKLQKKEDYEMEETCQILRDNMNNELDKEHPLHDCNDPKDVNEDYEHDEGHSPIDNAEQR